MTAVQIGGGLWVPMSGPAPYLMSVSSGFPSSGDSLLMDADEEEVQMIGRICLPGGPGSSKTFGTSGSKVNWNSGASITFQATATLRVGVKRSASISAASGPPARATSGAAAFDVYGDLVGGTDTISSTSPITVTMAAGTPFTVTHGDLIAICFHLDVTANAQSVKVRQSAASSSGAEFPACTLVTASGATFTRIDGSASAVLTFDDGSIGYFDCGTVCYGLASETIGNTNIYGNVLRLPVPCEIDAVAVHFTSAGGTSNIDIGIWTDPAGTPTAHAGNVSADPQIMAAGANRYYIARLSSAYSLAANTDILIGAKQNSATGITVKYVDYSNADFMQIDGCDSTVYAAKSTAGGAVAAANSGLRRAHVWAHISKLDNGAGGGGVVIAGTTMRRGMV